MIAAQAIRIFDMSILAIPAPEYDRCPFVPPGTHLWPCARGRLSGHGAGWGVTAPSPLADCSKTDRLRVYANIMCRDDGAGSRRSNAKADATGHDGAAHCAPVPCGTAVIHVCNIIDPVGHRPILVRGGE